MKLTNSNQGEISTFNEGSLQMLRIHEQQRKINLCRISPLQKDIETGRYFYEIIFSCLNSLFSECSSKLSGSELEEGLEARKKIDEFLLTHKIWKKINNRNHKYAQNKIPDFVNFKILESLLFVYELKIRQFLEAHNLTAPKGENPEKAAYK